MSGREKFIPSRRKYTKRHTLRLSIGCVTPALSAHPPVLAIIVAVWLMQYHQLEIQLLARGFLCGCRGFWLHFFCCSCICAFFGVVDFFATKYENQNISLNSGHFATSRYLVAFFVF